MNYKEVRADYNILEIQYGQVNDFTGVFEGDNNIADDLLGDPCKANAKKIMISIIQYGFSGGTHWNSDEGKILISENSTLQRLYDKYCT